MVILRSQDWPDVSFRGKHGDEAFHSYFHLHWFLLLWPLCKFVFYNLIILAVGYFFFIQATGGDEEFNHAALLLLTFLFLLTSWEFFVRFYRHLLTVIVITDTRVHKLDRTLFLINDHQSIDLWMLQDIDKRQHGIFRNLLGFGRIILEAQETRLDIQYVPNVEKEYEVIMHLREKARQRYGPRNLKLKKNFV